MNYLTRYIKYLKNNPEGYWFKRKTYGWGWVPAKWQGWLTLAIFLGIFVWALVPFVSTPDPTKQQVISYLVKVLVWAGLLILVCYLKGQPPKWQWGIPDEKLNSSISHLEERSPERDTM